LWAEKFSGIPENIAALPWRLNRKPVLFVPAQLRWIRTSHKKAFAGLRILLCSPAPAEESFAADRYGMSYKIATQFPCVTRGNGTGDIIGPSHKKIKVVTGRLSIYAFGFVT
jgi:hypothetical protein